MEPVFSEMKPTCGNGASSVQGLICTWMKLCQSSLILQSYNTTNPTAVGASAPSGSSHILKQSEQHPACQGNLHVALGTLKLKSLAEY